MNEFMDDENFDFDAKDENGQTAIHHAARTGEAAAGGMLVECGANPDIADNDGNTPLMIAAINNKRLVASMLLWGNCNRMLKNNKGNTALHEAAIASSHDVAWLIVENGGEETVLEKNPDGKTPLDLARLTDNQELIEILEKSHEEMSKLQQ
eukprot:CAMPEP_0206450348 /NCGR_PEP_ID=MMETSP0324_2-20121206/18669_1 /ASSEMBLY_ACC=CAM_ASM_000836 /TAXON_ID=2866 /ORGANISM="Crypthecodinium cohnii, Strain Seligo" /LENGTH=151 /DNA_ID=CAMNT_0053919975 /DNA_START=136 /DNA_END=591 /DNA_ORIENTATION=+